MTKFHLKDNGDPAVCKAAQGNCPLADDVDHFKTPEDARDFYEATHESSFEEDNNAPYWITDPFTKAKMVFNKNQFGLDRKTVEAFTEGDCWRLAFDLHKKLGYPVFVMTPESDTKGDRDSLFFNHMFVRNPTTGKFLDINGEHSEEELFEAGWAGDCEKPTIFEVSDNLKIGQASPPLYKKHSSEEAAEDIIQRLSLK